MADAAHSGAILRGGPCPVLAPLSGRTQRPSGCCQVLALGAALGIQGPSGLALPCSPGPAGPQGPRCPVLVLDAVGPQPGLLSSEQLLP